MGEQYLPANLSLNYINIINFMNIIMRVRTNCTASQQPPCHFISLKLRGIRFSKLHLHWEIIWGRYKLRIAGKVQGALRETCPNTEFFLVRIFPCLDWIRRFLLIQSKYGKIRTRKNSVFRYFLRSGDICNYISLKRFLYNQNNLLSMHSH